MAKGASLPVGLASYTERDNTETEGARWSQPVATLPFPW